MDLCVIDWAIFSNYVVAGATVFTGVVAICIFSKWAKQKRMEVIADVAKSLMADIFKVKRVLGEIEVKKRVSCESLELLSKITYDIEVKKELMIFDRISESDKATLNNMSEEIEKFADKMAQKINSNSVNGPALAALYTTLDLNSDDSNLRALQNLLDATLFICKKLALYSYS